MTTFFPRQRDFAVGPVQEFVKTLESNLFTRATDENAPSRMVNSIEVVDLEGNIVFPQCTYFGSTLRAEDDVMIGEDIVDRNRCRSQVVHIDEPSYGFLPEQFETLVGRQSFKWSLVHEQQ